MPSRLPERIRSLREARGLSLRALADAAGISAAALSQIENGQTSPSVATLEKLAYGLRIPMAGFFAEEENGSTLEVLSLEACPDFALGAAVHLVPLAAQRHPAPFEPVLIRLAPGGRLGEQPFLVGMETEFVWVRRGRALLEYEAETHTVAETQSVYYDPRQPHNWLNPFDVPCELLMVRSR